MLQRKHSKQQRSRPFWPIAAIVVIALILAGGWLIDRGLPPDERDEIERHYAQGVIAQALGDLAVARAEFEQVVALDPGYKDAQERLSQVIALMAAPPTPTLTAPAVHAPPTPTETPTPAATDTNTPTPTISTATPTLTPTSTSTNTPTPTSTVTPTDTPAPLRDIPIPIDNLANDEIVGLFPNFPLGEQKFGNVHFVIPTGKNKVSSQCENLAGWPIEFIRWPTVITIQTGMIAQPEKVFLLINAGFTSDYHAGQLGAVELHFSDGQTHVEDLVLGQNIREWNFTDVGSINQTSSPSVQEVYRGQNYLGRIAAIDMLEIEIPQRFRDGVLTTVVINDESRATLGSENPCFFIVGVTVQARS